MAGAGFDAAMIRDADALKERLGRVAYLWSGSRNLRAAGFGAEIAVDGVRLVRGQRDLRPARQPGRLFGGVDVFPDARPDDGMLELGIVTAEGLAPVGPDARPHRGRRPDRSPFVRTTQGASR